MNIGELLSISPVYSILIFILAFVFVVIGFKVAKWLFWILAVITIIIGLLMIFVF